MSQLSSLEHIPGAPAFVGLAPFLRRSIAGEDLRPLAQLFLDQATVDQDDADSLMNLAVVLQCIGSREAGLNLLGEALNIKTTYVLPMKAQIPRCRLLMLMVPGDLSANTPLDCLLEDCDIELVQHFLDPANPSLENLPVHDVLFAAISEGDSYNALLQWLSGALSNHAKPVINRPKEIARLSRNEVSEYLAGVPGLLIPKTLRTGRAELDSIADGQGALKDISGVLRFPVIVRPLGSHGGHGLEKVDSPDALTGYLDALKGDDFYIANFVDYSGTDGLFRKMRIVLVEGSPYVAHVGISCHWMIHYLNAGMYEDPIKRREEAAFMQAFGSFAQRHAVALSEIHRRSGLDYLCIDCAETMDGQLLVFEIGNDMVVHAMDPEDLFPYKPPLIKAIVDAFRSMIFGRIG